MICVEDVFSASSDVMSSEPMAGLLAEQPLLTMLLATYTVDLCTRLFKEENEDETDTEN